MRGPAIFSPARGGLKKCPARLTALSASRNQHLAGTGTGLLTTFSTILRGRTVQAFENRSTGGQGISSEC